MASGGEQQASTSGNQQAPGASNGGAQTGALPCDPQAFAQFFQAFETFYRQCRPGALVLPPEPSQDVIPDTLPNMQGQQVLPGPSGANARSETSNSGRPNTRAQAAISKKATHNAGKGKPSAKGPGKGKASSKALGRQAPAHAIDIPSVFQEQQSHQSSTEDSEGSSLEEEQREPQVPQPGADGNAASAEKQGGKRKSKKKHTAAKKRRSKQSETEDESGTSSSDSDSEGPMDGYWGLGEGNHGIPLWAHERRANSHRKTFNGVLDWKDGTLVEDVKVATNQSTDFILGNHLSQKRRNKILNGDYVDMFTLLPPTKLLGKGEKRRSSGKGRYRTPRAERTFENWLDGYQVFMGVVCAAYPRRAMDLVAYLAHVRRAHSLAGEQAALTYDENFRRNASLLPSTRWDLTDPNFWGEDVTPYIERRNQGMVKAGRTEVKRRRLCWEFNKGTCSRPSCKYLHECERCWGNHPATACFKNKQQPFWGGRGYFHNSNRGAPGASHQGTGNRQ
ncbi:finger 703-like [Podarcis lilfordi]|uniref:Finger 703-like n=1 Tax=Podarcis lilfordi TaxID=74358 RepID=A0AA35NSJ6_9SAUR|nr:finger 703-like [Podarcis lilfordi]